MIDHSGERISTAPETNGSVLYTTPADLALHVVILGLVCGCSDALVSLETQSVKLLTNSSCADVASRGSFATEDGIFTSYMLHHSGPILLAC